MKRPAKALPCLLSVGLIVGCNDGSTAASNTPPPVELGNYPKGCSKPIAPFRTEKDGLDHHAIVFVVTLLRDNRILLNGEEIEESKLRLVANEANDFSPHPYFVLEIDPGTPCGFVIEHRSKLGKTALCGSGHCAEGRDPNSWPIRMGPQP